jgi:opacity protein-like surface antigen
MRRILASAFAAAAIFSAQAAVAADQPYQVEWVYHVKYGYQQEWWKLFQKYQVAILDREKQLGFVSEYHIDKPGLHTSEDARWDYRIVITYPSYDGSRHEGDVERQLFPDRAVLNRDENRRWELTLNHWDLPIHQIDPHSAAD